MYERGLARKTSESVSLNFLTRSFHLYKQALAHHRTWFPLIATLQSRHSTLERSLKRRQALEAALYDDEDLYGNTPKADRKRNKASATFEHP